MRISITKKSCGIRPATGEDTGTAALLAALYDRFGSGFVEKLRGGFSFVLWDRRERKLLAAVDGVGVKRLVYYHDAQVLLIASRIDALTRTTESIAKSIREPSRMS